LRNPLTRKLRPAVFLDRDGTLIWDAKYLRSPEQVKFFSKTATALKMLRKVGLYLFIVTNQSGVARGFFPESTVKKVHKKMQSFLAPKGAGVHGFFYCPHFKSGKVKSLSRVCGCRKPKPGMIRQAVRRFPVDLKRSYMVGDKLDDALLARNARLAGSVTVLTGNGRRTRRELKAAKLKNTVVKAGILQAAKWIIRQSLKQS
jgi:D-glycero-D-manno-heptose 1,7-bisphosphate phosphatase